MARLIVIGSSNTDLVITGGRLPVPGETVTGGEFAQFAGGKGANQAVAAARAGVEVAFIGARGADEFGRAALEGLQAEGINCAPFREIGDAASGVALILIGGEQKENLISVAGGANDRLAPADAEAAGELIAAADAVLASLEVPLDAVSRAFELARAGGIRTILNPAPMPAGGLPSELLALCDLIVPNEIEAQQLGEVDAELLVTLGARGCRLGEQMIPAPKVEPLDTVGAGDCFCAWLAVGLAGGQTIEAAAERACRAAAISVTRRGAQAGMPQGREVAA